MTVTALRPEVQRKPTVTVCQSRPPTEPEIGAYAGTGHLHGFSGEFFCLWCFGDREDWRHWLPPVQQAWEDAMVRWRCDEMPIGRWVRRGHP
jgi:hypothetical protein